MTTTYTYTLPGWIALLFLAFTPALVPSCGQPDDPTDDVVGVPDLLVTGLEAGTSLSNTLSVNYAVTAAGLTLEAVALTVDGQEVATATTAEGVFEVNTLEYQDGAYTIAVTATFAEADAEALVQSVEVTFSNPLVTVLMPASAFPQFQGPYSSAHVAVHNADGTIFAESPLTFGQDLTLSAPEPTPATSLILTIYCRGANRANASPYMMTVMDFPRGGTWNLDFVEQLDYEQCQNMEVQMSNVPSLTDFLLAASCREGSFAFDTSIGNGRLTGYSSNGIYSVMQTDPPYNYIYDTLASNPTVLNLDYADLTETAANFQLQLPNVATPSLLYSLRGYNADRAVPKIQTFNLHPLQISYRPINGIMYPDGIYDIYHSNARISYLEGSERIIMRHTVSQAGEPAQAFGTIAATGSATLDALTENGFTSTVTGTDFDYTSTVYGYESPGRWEVIAPGGVTLPLFDHPTAITSEYSWVANPNDINFVLQRFVDVDDWTGYAEAVAGMSAAVENTALWEFRGLEENHAEVKIRDEEEAN